MAHTDYIFLSRGKWYLLLALILSLLPQSAAASEVYLDLHGYYRMRMNWFTSLKYDIYRSSQTSEGVEQATNEKISLRSHATYIDQRLRLDPEIVVNEFVSLFMQIDILSNSLLGYNPAGGSPDANFLLYHDPSATSYHYLYNESLAEPELSIRRAYGKVALPIGNLYLGRMPLQWGMGLVYNAGDNLNSNYGTTYDGLYYFTKPGSWLGNRFSDLYCSFGYFKLIEGNILADDDVKEWLVSVFSTDEDIELLDKLPFWQRQMRDNWLGLRIAMRSQGDESAPYDAYSNEGLMWTMDFFVRRHMGPLFFMSEIFWMVGEVDQAYPHPLFPDKRILYNEVDINQLNGAARLGWQSNSSVLTLEYGRASGADRNELFPPYAEQNASYPLTKNGDPTEVEGYTHSSPVFPAQHLNGGRFNPDYDVDLILFEQLMNLYTGLSNSVFDDSQSGVFNSQYLRLNAEGSFAHDKISVGGYLLYAWLTSNKGNFWAAKDTNLDGQINAFPQYENIYSTTPCTGRDDPECVVVKGADGSTETVKKVDYEIARDDNGQPIYNDFTPSGRNLGVEIGGKFGYHFQEWFTWELDTALAFPGGFFDDLIAISRYQEDSQELTVFRNNAVFTIQTKWLIHF